MKTLKKINPYVTIYLIGIILGMFILAGLWFFSILILASCGMDYAFTFNSCGRQLLAISGSLVMILITACCAAWKYPFASGLVLFLVGGIVLVMMLFITTDSYYIVIPITFFIDGLVFLSMGSFKKEMRKFA
jgi:hypothetical protein